MVVSNSLPIRSAEGRDVSHLCADLQAVPFSCLSHWLREAGLCHIHATGDGLKHLRFYHLSRGNTNVYAFLNEAIYGAVDAQLTLPQDGSCLIYEPWGNQLYRAEAPDGVFRLRLEKANMIFLIFGDEVLSDIPQWSHEVHRVALSQNFEISIKEEGDEEFRTVAEQSDLFDISSPDRFPHFSGSVKYRTAFEARDGYSVLDLGDVGEVAEVWLNGQRAGVRIDAPYRFDMAPYLQAGTNQLEVVVTSNLAHRRRDGLSCFIQIPPTGLLGPISLCRYEA